jgi:hypothetical protein
VKSTYKQGETEGVQEKNFSNSGEQKKTAVAQENISKWDTQEELGKQYT